MKKIEINNFAKRQTRESRFSYYAGTTEELINLVEENFNKAKAGYKDGILMVPVPAEGFYSAVCKIEEDSVLESRVEARRAGEEPVIVTVVKNGKKLPAKEVNIVLYRHDVLGTDATSDAEWEIISINASLVEGGEPMTPAAMARNMLCKTGGTEANYTAEQFAEAVWFWSQHAMTAGESH